MGQVNGWAKVTQLIVAESERFQVHRPLVPMTFSLHDASFKNGKDVRICKLNPVQRRGKVSFCDAKIKLVNEELKAITRM